mmetsp:Transcript_25837/g.80570  ORF Transcript_25837/g.80570 Transcript_25837/m.80570 type:complete len:398 (+) Transcript_25837:53-1246(+)
MSAAPGAPGKHGYPIHIESSATWAHERGDLFDFEADTRTESARVSHQDFVVLDSAACVRNGANVNLMPKSEVSQNTEGGGDHLVNLVRKKDSLWIHQGDHAAEPGGVKPSLIVKDLPGGIHWLQGGEIIRLGCARIRVRQVVLTALVQPSLKLDSGSLTCQANPEPPEAMEGTSCRICMLEGPNEDDPLIAPCGCKGSVKYVHLGCLREWIRVRRSIPPAGEVCSGFEYHPLKCDLCKGSYASSVRYAPGQGFKESEPLIDMPLVKPPFVVLEVPGRHYGGGGRHSQVLSLAGEGGSKILMLGRAKHCHLRIPDASISRWHASLRLHDGKLLLEDHKSKFGTLVEVQRPIQFDPKRALSLSLQVGRTVLRLTPGEAAHGDASDSSTHPVLGGAVQDV